MYAGKYSLSRTDDQDCSLTIQNVDLRLDSGDWQCQVTTVTNCKKQIFISRR